MDKSEYRMIMMILISFTVLGFTVGRLTSSPSDNSCPSLAVIKEYSQTLEKCMVGWGQTLTTLRDANVLLENCPNNE